jgi:hypothetical protein
VNEEKIKLVSEILEKDAGKILAQLKPAGMQYRTLTEI